MRLIDADKLRAIEAEWLGDLQLNVARGIYDGETFAKIDVLQELINDIDNAPTIEVEVDI